MGLSPHLGGTLFLVVQTAAVALVGVAVRTRWLAGWRGAPARLAEVVAALGLVYGLGLLLGAVGALRSEVVGGALLVAGASAATWLHLSRRQRRVQTDRPTHPVGAAVATDGVPTSGSRADDRPGDTADPDEAVNRSPTWWTMVAAVATAATTAAWSVQVAASYRRGIFDGDTLWYHGPFAGRFLQSGWTTRVLHVNAEPLVAYFPANGELFQAMIALPLRHDVLMPAVNLGWLALALLGAWCVGRPWGRSPVGLAAVAVVAGLPVMTATQAGTARNDIVGLALLVAALGLLVQPGRRPAALALGGVACGLAVGVKVSMLVPAALVAGVGVAAVVLDRARGRAGETGWTIVRLGCWTVPIVVLGAYWYVRNWVRVGNPLPWLELRVGPLRWESPPLPQAAVGDSALVHRFGTPGWWDEMVAPALPRGVGPLWPALVGLVLLALALPVVGRPAGRWWSRPGRSDRGEHESGGHARTATLLALAGAVALAAYVVTPNSAPVAPEGWLARDIFMFNTRYALAGVLFAVLAIAAGAGSRRPAGAVVALLAGLAVSQLVPGYLRDAWEFRVTGRDAVGGLAVLAGVAAAVLVARALLVRLGGRAARHAGADRVAPRLARPAVVGVIVAGVAVGGLPPLADWYLDHRYRSSPYPAAELWAFGDRVEGAHIGGAGDHFLYPYLGATFANEVEYVGVGGPHGAFRDAETCREWRTALRDAGVDHVVVAEQMFGHNDLTGKQHAWTAAIPNSRVVLDGRAGSVFRLPDEIDPAGCP